MPVGKSFASNDGKSFISTEADARLSVMNFFENPSTSSTTEFLRTGKVKEVSIRDNIRLVKELVDDIFVEERGDTDISSSRCSSVDFKPSKQSFDQRLKYWKDVLADRKRLGAYITEQTGKKRGEILFNRTTTYDERDKQTVKRVLDYAERLNPINLQTKKRLRLKEGINMNTCQHMPALDVTLPKPEQDGEHFVEISGLPAMTKREQLGPCEEQGKERTGHWLRSKWLEKRIVENREDLERVVEFYPDIEKLQIVGESMLGQGKKKRPVDIRFLYEEHVKNISTSSSCDMGVESEQAMIESDEIPEYGVRINDHTFLTVGKLSSKILESESYFECEPFEKVIKRVLYLENIGQKIINCEWSHRAYYHNIPLMLKGRDEEFVFNRKPFRLLPGERRDIYVQFQPRTVNVIKEKWVLKIDPQFFCRRKDSIIMKFSGKCDPPALYVNKLEGITKLVLEKSNIKMMEKLTKNLASITPLIKPPEAVCPYKRSLDERELFEFNNPGYKCERFHDLELLKDIYNRVKKPREHPWDLRLETLQALVLRLEGADQRALVFAEMMGILEEMKGIPMDMETKITDCPERDRSRFLYVRGLICTSIDEWEDLTLSVEEAFYKPAQKEYDDFLAEEAQAKFRLPSLSQSVDLPPADGPRLGSTAPLDEDAIHELVMKKVRSRKAFRDALFMQTYTHMCDTIENIVSVIESTEII